MGDVVNLNKYRKRRAKLGKERRSAENRSGSGANPAERAGVRQVEERRNKELDGKRLEPPRPADEPPTAS
jgi:hypothetical protein